MRPESGNSKKNKAYALKMATARQAAIKTYNRILLKLSGEAADENGGYHEKEMQRL